MPTQPSESIPPSRDVSAEPPVSGIILAGGRSRVKRGELKALWPIDGEPLLARQIRLMRSWCKEIMVVTDTPRLYLPLVPADVRIVTDYAKGKGPLGGMAAGLSLAQLPYAWIVGSRMADLSVPAARLLLARCAAGRKEAVWPSDSSGPYPLHGIYACASAGRVVRLFEEGRRGLADLPRFLLWDEVTENEFARHGIAFDFVRERTAGGAVYPFPADRR
ncbi:molybdenum cofactor guanylyltransferase [Cohnella massiliensis]|uniref:molybdenum cofactor guanylyltransferase n=1 Tax=Cohnella massiliensis TaxID=1816691 RepID=UPI0009B9474A|nr:NTP transferase domain-containing protein [Cohnella massiliensis]